MGNIRMVVLTKSSKYGNNCVAGIDLSNGDWVRLVTEDEASHGAVSDNDLICEDGRSVEVLDVIDAPILGLCNDCVQPENVLLDLNCTHKTGHEVCVNHRESQVIDSKFMGILNIRH